MLRLVSALNAAVVAHAIVRGVSLAGRKQQSTPGKCVVWHSQHKSAGASIELQLTWKGLNGTGWAPEDWRKCSGCRFLCDAGSFDCEQNICREPDTFQEAQSQKMALRGYVQTLQGTERWGRAGDGKCIWATLTREPTSRLVSAYLYCKHGGDWDPLCGTARMRAANATIEEFAEHWGNFLFRELMWFPELRALAESRPDFNHTKHCKFDKKHGFMMHDRKVPSWRDPWVAFKDQLNGGDDINTESGAKNLHAVKEHLRGKNGASPLYDVNGVVEEMQASMLLFHKFMPLAGRKTWMEAVGPDNGITHYSEDYDSEESKTLRQALGSDRVQRAIAGDLILYHNVIVPHFHKQLVKHHISA